VVAEPAWAPIMDSPAEMLEQIFLRRTEISDADVIEGLVSQSTTDLFGEVKAVNIIEKAVLSVTAVNGAGKIVGHASFYDYPVTPATKKDSWEAWLDESYVAEDIAPLNTLFLAFYVAEPSVANHVTTELIRTLFVAVPDLKNCVLAPLEPLETGNALCRYFSPLKVKDEEVSNSVYVASNTELFPNVHVRIAAPQDFDDLVPIFNAQSSVLQQRYGSDEFYLAELIEAQDEFNKCLVMEVDETAVGFMSITTELDTTALLECFDFAPWNNLKSSRTVTRVEVIEEPKEEPKEEGEGEGEAEAKDGDKKAKDGDKKAGKDKKKPKSGKKGPEKDGSVSGKSRKSVGIGKKGKGKAGEEDAVVKVKKPKTRTIEEEVWYESAFAIAMMCIDEEYEARSLDFMAEAFNHFADKNFCVLTLPHTSGEPPLLNHFSRVIPKPRACPPHEAYVMHRHGLFTDVTVTKIDSDDHQGVEELLKTMDKTSSDLIIADLQRVYATGTDPNGVPIDAFVARSCGSIVGIAIGRSAKDDSFRLRAHYNVEEFILSAKHATYEHGYLHHFMLNPVFDRHRKFVLREVMRLWGKTCVYYRHYAEGADLKGISPYTVSPILDDMVPVRRRRQIVYPLDALMSNAPSQRIRDNGTPYALSFLNRKLMHEPKISINHRIVVIGCSDTAVSLLETLCAIPHLCFNNLVLVSPHGLTSGLESSSACGLLSDSHAYTGDDYQQIGLQMWVNVVKDKMVQIDRESHMLGLASGATLPYDLLILAPGLQYLAETEEQSDPPRNVFAVNDAADAEGVVEAIKTVSDAGRMVVYGDTLDAYAALEGLLSLGITGDKIDFVRPPSAGGKFGQCFDGNQRVLAAVEEAIMAKDIIIHDGLSLKAWISKDDDELSAATFSDMQDGEQALDCEVFLNYSEKVVDPANFEAVNDSCLVFDGRLVVNNQFGTADSDIFAAGPFTKYSRKYRVDNKLMHLYNAAEVGRRLAESILPLVDPLSARNSLTKTEVISLKESKIIGCKLPGGLQYLQQAMPGPAEDIVEARQMVTDPTADRPLQYMRLGVDAYSKICSLHVLTSADELGDRANLLHLFGTHERYINNLVSRFDEKLIENLLEYLRHPSILAVYHDRFMDFVGEISESTRNNGAVDLVQYADVISKLAALKTSARGDESAAKELQAEIVALDKGAENMIDNPNTKQAAKGRLLDFLNFNSYHLPMYARPGTW